MPFPLTTRGRVTIAVVIAVATGLAVDLSRPPARQHSTALLLWGVRAYRATASPVLAAAGLRCRFAPTCSRYAEVVIRRHGTLTGSWRTLARVVRCGPWTPAGTVDPPR